MRAQRWAGGRVGNLQERAMEKEMEEMGEGICDKRENGGCASREVEEINKAR